jgi:hypothetical protein
MAVLVINGSNQQTPPVKAAPSTEMGSTLTQSMPALAILLQKKGTTPTTTKAEMETATAFTQATWDHLQFP